MKKMVWMVLCIGLVGGARATTIFSAATDNTTLVNNGFNASGVPILTGATPDLLYSNPGGNNNNGGFASTVGLDVLLGSSLTVTQEVRFSATVDSITAGTLQANGIVFGMSQDTDFQSANNLLLAVKANGAAAIMDDSAFVDANAGAGFSIVESSFEDGFDITLTANNDGYTFTLTDVVTGTAATTASFSGTFAPGDFTNYFGAAHFYMTAQTDGAPSPMVVDVNAATLSVGEYIEAPGVFFEATTNNTTLFNNGTADNGLLTLSGAMPDLVLNNDNGGFNNGGFASTETMSTLLGTALDSTNAVAISVTVDSIGGAGELRANGITFGIAGAPAFNGGTSHYFLLGIGDENSGSHVTLTSSFVADTDTGISVEQSSLEDGFSITLTANSSGYIFELTDIEVSGSGNTTASHYGSFSGTEFVDTFNDGHFYLAAQKFNTGDIELDISEASMALTEVTELTPLASAMAKLKSHINGSSTLTAAQINAEAAVIETYADEVGNTSGNIIQAHDLVDTYETVKGALFINGTTSAGFSRTDKSTADKALAHALFAVYQAILDDVYNAGNLAAYRDLLDGSKFVSADFWPGAATPPSDSSAVYSVQINASQPKAWGYAVDFMTLPARRPTGAYLAPGSIATVTVPAALVGKGFEIRVGSHVADLSNRPNEYKRFNRVTLTYPITSTSTEVANPLGGAIYIEVPYEIEEGVVTVEIQNTIRSPFYSSTAHRQTSLSEWQDTERLHPGPWADFESDKFMLNVPTDWIYAYANAVTLMANWDKAMDACSDMQGLPRVRPKTVLYCQIDATLDANAYSPGYPQSNDNYNPNSSAGGNKSHDYLNGPKYADFVHLHEFGHASSITKFSGEMEAVVNLFNVPMHNRMFDVTLDEAFGRSMGNSGCKTVSRDQAALLWILSDKFRAGNAQAATDMKYQHRGYGKYVEIAGLFGWDALGDFWKSVAVDYENGITYSKNYDPPDSRIIRMSRAAGANLLPLIHMWGVHPGNASSIQSTLDSEGIDRSAAIYDRLVHYQSIVPQTVAEFEAHYQKVKNAPLDSDFFTTMRSDWNATYAAASIAKVQEIIDTYFPDGRPIETLPHFEDFEDGIGGWAQATDDNYEWRRNSGGTATGNAGPDGAAAGDYYMYAEGHDAGGGYKTSSFQCTFDFSGVTGATMTFDYHMFGNYIDFMSVDVYDGTTWTSDVWKRTGQQHTSSSDAWSGAEVDLSAFGGNDEVTIRFRAKNGQWNASDSAIDNIVIDEITPYGQWSSVAFFGAPVGTDQTAAGNPDGDQFNNQLEWAFNIDPLTADQPALDTSVSNTFFVALFERRDPSVTGVDVYASWATSLTSTVWKVHGDGMIETSEGWSNDVETVSASIPLGQTNAFIRIQAVEPE